MSKINFSNVKRIVRQELERRQRILETDEFDLGQTSQKPESEDAANSEKERRKAAISNASAAAKLLDAAEAYQGDASSKAMSELGKALENIKATLERIISSPMEYSDPKGAVEKALEQNKQDKPTTTGRPAVRRDLKG